MARLLIKRIFCEGGEEVVLLSDFRHKSSCPYYRPCRAYVIYVQSCNHAMDWCEVIMHYVLSMIHLFYQELRDHF